LVLVFLAFFLSCSSISAPGTIARQADLVADLEEKLPEDDRQRYRNFLKNIVQEEKVKDDLVEDAKKKTEVATSEAMEAKEDAGKWAGLRNFAFYALIAVTVFFALRFVVKTL